MKVIVSNNTIEYSGFLKVKTLSAVFDIEGTIEILVYHKSSEKENDKIRALTDLKDKVGRLIYIRNLDDCEKAIQLVVVGSKGKYFDDEFFLRNSQELNNLVSNIEEVTSIVSMGGVNVVSDFFNKYLTDGSGSFSKEYLLTVKSAVTDMIAQYREKDMELLEMSETATDIFSSTIGLVSSMEEDKKSLQKSIDSLKEARENMTASTSVVPRRTSVSFFNTVNYAKDKKILRIKEVGNVSYLTSFILGFKEYLEKARFVRVKVIFILPVGEFYEQAYSNFNWISQNNYSTNKTYYTDDIVFTNFPITDVIIKLLDDRQYDLFIVVDRLMVKSHILNCKLPPVKYAVSGERLINNFNLKKVDCFVLNKKVKSTMFSLDYSPDYPETESNRIDFYLRTYKQVYDNLVSLVGR